MNVGLVGGGCLLDTSSAPAEGFVPEYLRDLRCRRRREEDRRTQQAGWLHVHWIQPHPSGVASQRAAGLFGGEPSAQSD